MASLAERLDAARRRHFVGRQAECDLLEEALAAAELPYNILHIHGTGGVGKTSLLREFYHRAKALQITPIYLDSRNLDPSPSVFTLALQQACGIRPPITLQHHLSQQAERYLILIDTSELLTPLDGWLRDEFFPQMPTNVLTIFAGRNPPALEWRTDPGWQTLVRVVQLRNLAPADSYIYLQKRNIPAAHHATLLDFTYGHPLALSLMADLFAQQGDLDFRPKESPDLIAALVERFISNMPDPDHRAALEACAKVRVMTEPLLAQMLERDDVYAIFAWLRALSFIETDPEGIYPHDLAREAITADLRWRNPSRYLEFHVRARQYYMTDFATSDSWKQQSILQDTIYLHRDNLLVRPYFEWQLSGTIYHDQLQPADQEAILDAIERHEGANAVQGALYWLTHQPEMTTVFRDGKGELQGALVMVALEKTTAQEQAADPAIQRVLHYLDEHAPLRPGERATLFRFWLAFDGYQTVSPVQSRIFLTMVQHYLTTPGLAYTFLPCAEPDFWMKVFRFADLARLREADYTVDGKSYGMYGHDWRAVPPLAWLDRMVAHEGVNVTPRAQVPARATETLLVLSQSDFVQAVRDALRDYRDPNALRGNPLLKSRVVLEEAGAQSEMARRVEVLTDLLMTLAQPMTLSPRQNKYYRALHHTYFQPAATQEQAAELLNIPFSSYRRHLRSGIDFLCEALWQREIEG